MPTHGGVWCMIASMSSRGLAYGARSNPYAAPGEHDDGHFWLTNGECEVWATRAGLRRHMRLRRVPLLHKSDVVLAEALDKRRDDGVYVVSADVLVTTRADRRESTEVARVMLYRAVMAANEIDRALFCASRTMLPWRKSMLREGTPDGDEKPWETILDDVWLGRWFRRSARVVGKAPHFAATELE